MSDRSLIIYQVLEVVTYRTSFASSLSSCSLTRELRGLRELLNAKNTREVNDAFIFDRECPRVIPQSICATLSHTYLWLYYARPRAATARTSASSTRRGTRCRNCVGKKRAARSSVCRATLTTTIMVA